jgi:hypothetical protein
MFAGIETADRRAREVNENISFRAQPDVAR